MQYAAAQGVLTDAVALEGSGFVGVDALSSLDDDKLNAFIDKFVRERLKLLAAAPGFMDACNRPRSLSNCKAKLLAVSGDKYSYRELDQFTDLIERSLHTLPEVSRITRHGNLGEQINLDFSQERLASYGIQPLDLKTKLENRNILPAGGVLEVVGKNLPIRPTGEFKSEKDIGGLVVATSESGAPVYLRDLVDISRDYESPSRYLGFLSWKDKAGQWHRTRGVTLAVFMRTEEHIDKFAQSVNACFDSVRQSAAFGPCFCPHVRSTCPGQRKHRPLYDEPGRSHCFSGAGCTYWFLGMALGPCHSPVNSDNPGNDICHDASAPSRYPAVLGGRPYYQPGLIS